MRPGTSSKILWHFTGGWLPNSESNRSPEDAYSNLKAILRERKLKIGPYSERIRVGGREISTDRVCCFADIPIIHLGFHEQKYGKFALGFRREFLISKQFNPVFYVRQNKAAATRFQSALDSLDNFETESLEFSTEVIMPTGKIDREILEQATNGIKDLGRKAKEAARNLKTMQSFIKTFNDDEDFESVYCEREWRNNVDLDFSVTDVAMIILPKDGGYFRQFAEEDGQEMQIPRTVPIVPWEDLIEH